MRNRLCYILFLIASISACKENNSSLYINYIRQFQESIQMLDRNNKSIYIDFEEIMFENPDKTRKWYDPAFFVKNYKIKLFHFIDSIQANLDTAIYEKILNNKELDPKELDRKVSLKQSDIDFIKLKIVTYNNHIKAFINNPPKYYMLIESIDSVLSISNFQNVKTFKGKSVSIVELLACMSMLKTHIVFAETDFLSYSHNQVDHSCFKFYKLEALVVPNSQFLPLGYPYKAEIFLASIDTTLNPAFEIDGKEFETKSAIGTYKFKVTKEPGIYSKRGNFMVKSPASGEIQKYPFKIEYEVLERN